MPPALRLATPADAGAMAALGRSVWPDDYIAADPLAYLAEGEVLVAEDAQGLTAMGKWERMPDGSAWVSGLRVRSDQRRGGLARALVQGLLARAAEQRAYPARMLVGDANVASLSLAASVGFRMAAHWALLVREGPAPVPAPPGPLLGPPGPLYPLEGALLAIPGFYMRAMEATVNGLTALAREGRFLGAPDGSQVLRTKRDTAQGTLLYYQVLNPAAAALDAVARDVEATPHHRAVVIVPFALREPAEALLALGFRRSEWAWGAQVLELQPAGAPA